MSLQLIAEGTRSNFSDVSLYEDYIGEGQEAILEIGIGDAADWIVNPIIWSIQTALDLRGVNLTTPVYREGDHIVIQWKKGFPWLAVIVAALLIIGTLWVLMNFWKLYNIIPEPLKPLVGIAIGVAVIAAVWSFVKPGIKEFTRSVR